MRPAIELEKGKGNLAQTLSAWQDWAPVLFQASAQYRVRPANSHGFGSLMSYRDAVAIQRPRLSQQRALEYIHTLHSSGRASDVQYSIAPSYSIQITIEHHHYSSRAPALLLQQ